MQQWQPFSCLEEARLTAPSRPRHPWRRLVSLTVSFPQSSSPTYPSPWQSDPGLSPVHPRDDSHRTPPGDRDYPSCGLIPSCFCPRPPLCVFGAKHAAGVSQPAARAGISCLSPHPKQPSADQRASSWPKHVAGRLSSGVWHAHAAQYAPAVMLVSRQDVVNSWLSRAMKAAAHLDQRDRANPCFAATTPQHHTQRRKHQHRRAAGTSTIRRPPRYHATSCDVRQTAKVD